MKVAYPHVFRVELKVDIFDSEIIHLWINNKYAGQFSFEDGLLLALRSSR